MAVWTLEEAKAKLQKWLAAEDEVASAQSVTSGDNAVYRAKLEEIRTQIKFWANEVDRLEKQADGKSTFQRLHTRFV